MANSSIPTIIWDFEGTLVYHVNFYNIMIKVLDEYEPGHNIAGNDLRCALNGLLPWHKPQESHLHLSVATCWWKHVEDIFASSFIKVGYEKERAYQLAGLTHKKFIKPSNFLPYNDTLETLSFFHQRGWRNIILSNNVPDLPEIVEHTDLGKFIDKSFSSANIGFEKPNPEVFRFALNYAENPQNVWMVGDSLESDIIGAQALGIKTVLVHHTDNCKQTYTSRNLINITKIIL